MGTESKLSSDPEVIAERAVEKHLVALTAFLSASEIPEAKQAYCRAFELIFYDTPDENWPEPLEEAIRKAVEAVVALGPGGPAQVLRDWRLLKEMGPPSAYVEEIARKVVLQEVQVTPDIKEKLESAERRLEELGKKIDTECPYLLDARSPQPALRLIRPKTTRLILGNALLDCAYILGKSRYMSLHLGHDYKAAQARAKRA